MAQDVQAILPYGPTRARTSGTHAGVAVSIDASSDVYIDARIGGNIYHSFDASIASGSTRAYDYAGTAVSVAASTDVSHGASTDASTHSCSDTSKVSVGIHACPADINVGGEVITDDPFDASTDASTHDGSDTSTSSTSIRGGRIYATIEGSTDAYDDSFDAYPGSGLTHDPTGNHGSVYDRTHASIVSVSTHPGYARGAAAHVQHLVRHALHVHRHPRRRLQAARPHRAHTASLHSRDTSMD